MKRERLAQALTLVLLGALAGTFIDRQRRAPAGREEVAQPEGVIWRMVEASRAQDPNRYLSCFTGELERRLEKNLQDMGRARFRASLADALSPVKGIAVKSPQTLSRTEARVAVEFVYADGNEVQQMYLRRVRTEWKIYRVDGAERSRALIPYGTPVND